MIRHQAIQATQADQSDRRRPVDAGHRIRDCVRGARRRGDPRLRPMTLRARLYDARGDDRDVDLTRDEVRRVDDERLLWIDLDERADTDLQTLAEALELQPAARRSAPRGSRSRSTHPIPRPNPDHPRRPRARGRRGRSARARRAGRTQPRGHRPRRPARRHRRLQGAARGRERARPARRRGLHGGLVDAVLQHLLPRDRPHRARHRGPRPGRAPICAVAATSWRRSSPSATASPSSAGPWRRTATRSRRSSAPTSRSTRISSGPGRARSIASSGRSTESRRRASCSSARSTSTWVGAPSARTTS